MRSSALTTGTEDRIQTVFKMASVRTGNGRIAIGVSGSACFLCLRPSSSMCLAKTWRGCLAAGRGSRRQAPSQNSVAPYHESNTSVPLRFEPIHQYRLWGETGLKRSARLHRRDEDENRFKGFPRATWRKG